MSARCMQLKVINYNDKGNRNYLDLKMDARDNVVNSLLSWANNKTRQFKADLSASTRFSEWKNESGQSKLHTEISLNKSPLILNDTLWNIAPSKITVDGGRIAIKNFSVSHNNEYLHMSGVKYTGTYLNINTAKILEANNAIKMLRPQIIIFLQINIDFSIFALQTYKNICYIIL